MACSRFLATDVLTFNLPQQHQIARSDVPVTGHANRCNQIVVPRGRVVQKLRRMEGPHGWMSLLLQSLAFWEMRDASTDQAVYISVIPPRWRPTWRTWTFMQFRREAISRSSQEDRPLFRFWNKTGRIEV